MPKRQRTHESNLRLERRQQKRRQETRRRIATIAVIAGGLILVAAVLFLIFRPEPRIDPAALVQPAEKTHPQAVGNKLGDPSAPVQVVEFADYLCSHCQDYVNNDEKAFLDNYVATGKVYYEYLGIAAQDPGQTRAIEATYCAGDQGAFWPYHDLVYANVARNTSALKNNYLTAYAESLELDLGAFNQCLRSNKYGAVNTENLQKANEAEIQGTPTFLVNGEKASRINLSQVVDAALAQASTD